jgi:hypothetical protein
MRGKVLNEEHTTTKTKLPMLIGGTAVRFCSRRKAWDG